MAETATRAKRSRKTAKAPARTVTDAHKKAMSQGREQGAAVRKYLDALYASRAPKRRGRRRTPDSIRMRLSVVEDSLRTVDDPLTRLKLVQDRISLQEELADLEAEEQRKVIDPTQFEDGFVKAAKDYAGRKGITYGAFREVGVPADVLKKAGITRRG